MYTDTTHDRNKLFDDTTEVLLDLLAKSKNGRLTEIYDLALKATEYYREYLEQNEPFDHTTMNYASRVTRRATCLPYIKDALVVPKQAITSWEVQDCNGMTHSKVEFLDHMANYGGGFL